MGKRLYVIWSILLVLVVSVGVLGLGCPPQICNLYVEATLCGEDWEGDVNYTLTGPGLAAPPLVINGTNVTACYLVDLGSWTCEYVSGGPAGATLVDITPSSTQELSESGPPITFTLNFELEQDAGITFETWTWRGIPWQPGTLDVNLCDWVDVHFEQWVDGCTGSPASVNETSVLTITQTGGPAPATIYVINHGCAVNKTLDWWPPTHVPPPPVKNSQVASINGEPVMYGDNITLVPQTPVELDVETAWVLTKESVYTKSINWLGISKAPFGEGDEHDCVLFELVFPMPGPYTFTLVASAEVELWGCLFGDQNSQNDEATSTQLTLTINVPPGG